MENPIKRFEHILKVINNNFFDDLGKIELILNENDIQINNLIKHRAKNGNLMTIYELQSIDGFDKCWRYCWSCIISDCNSR